jgi:hypothetical protein
MKTSIPLLSTIDFTGPGEPTGVRALNDVLYAKENWERWFPAHSRRSADALNEGGTPIH